MIEEADYNVEKGGHKEGKYDEQHQRKKGKKSKGYHNIFMKDEYKKDHTFYDMDHHQGHFDKKGSDNVKYHKNDEESEKGEKSDKEEDSHFDGKKGELAKGNHDKKDSHYKKESKYHNDKDDKESFKYDKGKHMGGHHYEIEH
ncbi:hypothetical protein PVAND_000130 [Polypedilum vanderplanki]|uniref:Uncharacterized protein n=1 Tax=Polypedilum vanderplanki TaxID=319348 RepID=A0A9J6BJS8_POLVA|nr:hypothetical protein PVAND_000130 [Polypedilum vanderplanki]